jgi:C4-type Zn-finger protein
MQLSLSVEKYLATSGMKCPKCLSENIEGIGPRVMDGNWMTNVVKCNDCTYKWKDIYTLTDIEEEV